MSKKNKKTKCDHTEKFERINLADVGRAVVLKQDTICKGPLYHMRNKVITEEEKIAFRYKKMSQCYLPSLIDHDTAMRFIFSD